MECFFEWNDDFLIDHSFVLARTHTCLVLLVVANEKMIDGEEEIVGEELEALAREHTSTLGVVVGLEVVVEHVVAVERVFCLLAEARHALVHLADHAVLRARLTFHQGRESHETLRTVLAHQRAQFLLNMK